MYCSFYNPKGRVALTLAVLGLLNAATAFAGEQKGQKIEFSDPAANSVSATDLDNVESTPSRLKPVERDSFRPSDFFQPQNNSPIHFRPPPQPQLDKRTLELLQKRKNWAFTDAEFLSPNSNLEDLMGMKQEGQEGLQKKSLSPMEKYYESLDSNKKLAKPLGEETLQVNPAREFVATNGIPYWQQGADSVLKKTFSGEDSNPFAMQPANSVAIFGSPAFIQAKQDKAQQQHMEEFRKLLEHTSTSPTANPYFNQAGFAQQQPNQGANSTGLPGNIQPTQPHNTLNPFLGVATAPTFHSRTTMDPTAKALGLPDPSWLQKPDPAPKTPPPSAFAAPLPKRAF
jgi:hypothetical protein